MSCSTIATSVPGCSSRTWISSAYRVVLSERGLAAGNAEYKARRDEKGTDVPLASVAGFLKDRLASA